MYKSFSSSNKLRGKLSKISSMSPQLMSTATFWSDLHRTLVIVVGPARATSAFAKIRRRILIVQMFFYAKNRLRVSPRVGLCTLVTALSDMPRLSQTEVKPILFFNYLPLKDQTKGWEIYLSIHNILAELSFSQFRRKRV